MPYGQDMSRVYFKKTLFELRQLRARKVRHLEKISGFNTFFAKRDRALLQHQIDQIEAVIESRMAQDKLL